jgi:hypothetical protein
MKRVSVTAAMTAAILVGVTGCSTTSDGTPTTPSTPSSRIPSSAESSAPALPHSGAPKVNNPLPESALPENPCDAFTRDQVEAALGSDAPEGERDDDFATGPRCHWADPVSGAGISAYLNTNVEEGLSAVYRNTKPQSGYWEELPPVQGFPSVVSSQDESPESSCHVFVGLADHYTVSASVANPRKPHATNCDSAERLADMLVGNLLQRAGR